MSTTNFHIPETVEGVAKLLTAHTWERAAIVWAYVHSFENGEQGNGVAVNSDSYGKAYTPESFAALKIAGLRSKNTVQKYWAAWQMAIDNKDAKPVHPGDDIEIPTKSKWIKNTAWTGTDDDPRAGTASRHVSEQQIINAITAKPDLVKDAIKANPTIVEEVYQEDAGVREATRRASEKRHEDIIDKYRPSCDYPEKPQSEDSRLISLIDGVVEEADRRDGVRMIRELAEAIDTKSKAWAEKWGHTGVSDEVSSFTEACSHLRSANARISTFAVVTENQDVTK